jgi:hypothetical protein
MQEGVVPEGWTQNDHDAYWSGFHAGEAHANYVDAYGPTTDTPAPGWVEQDPNLAHEWSHGYADGEVSRALNLS